jgi:hypothetical protein
VLDVSLNKAEHQGQFFRDGISRTLPFAADPPLAEMYAGPTEQLRNDWRKSVAAEPAQGKIGLW